MDQLDSSAVLVPEVGTLERRLERLRRVGYLLDNSIPIPGTRMRVGIDAIIGLVPGIGDLLGGLFSLYILAEASRLGASRAVLARMAWNVALDTLVGEIPLLGDLFDAGFKANVRNLALLEGTVARPAESQHANRRFVALLGLGLLLLMTGVATLAVVVIRALTGLFQ
jgi:hypothetical protein